jgi:DNA end-binding protein Ku
MARAIWSGAISFGLVNVPVRLYSGTRDHGVHFHQVDKGSGSRIRYEKVAETSGKRVQPEQIELGYEIDKGKLVVVDPKELDELRPATTRTIDISDFVNLSEIDPVYFNRTYWLAPDGEPALRAYRLLLAAMESSAQAGIGTLVMRNKQYLAAVRPREGALALSSMRFFDEVVAAAEVKELPSRGAKPDAKELRLATQIIDSMSGPWKPESYHDTYTEEVRRLVRAHEKGRDLVVEPRPADRVSLDLTAALEASLDAARSKGDRFRALEKAAERLEGEAGQSDGDSGQSSQKGSAAPSRGRSRSSRAAAPKAPGSSSRQGKGTSRRRSASSSTARKSA